MIDTERHPLSILAKRYPQLCLPVKEGAGESLLYRAVVLRGKEAGPEPLGFTLSAQDTLRIYHTPAGDAEVLYLSERADFERAVCALAYHCEPKQIPPSMGATTINGLIDWGKIHAHRTAYEASGGTEWNEEFRRFTAVTENYRDTLILVGKGFYSAVPPEQIGLPPTEWRERSLRIRIYHELTHFVCRKRFPRDIDAIRDEVLADAVGVVAAFGTYCPELARLFLGIEGEAYRSGGRLENYCADRGDLSETMTAAKDWTDRVNIALGDRGCDDPFETMMILLKEFLEKL